MFKPQMNNVLKNLGIDITQLSILLLSISLILWSVSILFSSVKIGKYGLIHGINPLYFVAMSIITLSFFITIKNNSKNNKILILHLITIFLFTALIPVLIEGTPRFFYNFETTSNVDMILQWGHSNSEIARYQTWPGVFYLDSIISLITEITPFNSILVLTTLFVVFIQLPITYLFFSTFLNKKETWAALLLNCVLFFGSPVYLLPGVIGGMMANFAFLIFLRSQITESKDSPSIRIVFIIFCSAAVVSHFLSVVGFLVVLLIFSVFFRIYKGNMDKKFILLFVFIATWQLYLAGSFAIEQISSSVNTAFGLEETLKATQSAAFGGSNAHTQIIYVKIVSILLLSFLGFLGLFYEIIWKRKFTLKNLALPTWIFANFSITTITSYGGEILSRTFAGSTTVLYMLGAKIINNEKLSLIFLLILLISPPLSIINAYGNEAIDYVSPIELEGADFLFNYHAQDSVVKSFRTRVWTIHSFEDFQNWGIDIQNMTLEKLTPLNERGVRKDFYILVGKMDMDTYSYMNGPTNFNFILGINNSQIYNKIYDSPGFTLYEREGIK